MFPHLGNSDTEVNSQNLARTKSTHAKDCRADVAPPSKGSPLSLSWSNHIERARANQRALAPGTRTHRRWWDRSKRQGRTWHDDCGGDYTARSFIRNDHRGRCQVYKSSTRLSACARVTTPAPTLQTQTPNRFGLQGTAITLRLEPLTILTIDCRIPSGRKPSQLPPTAWDVPERSSAGSCVEDATTPATGSAPPQAHQRRRDPR